MVRPTDEQILAIVRERPDIGTFDLARALGCIRLQEHVTDDCAEALRDALDRGVLELGSRLGFVARTPKAVRP